MQQYSGHVLKVYICQQFQLNLIFKLCPFNRSNVLNIMLDILVESFNFWSMNRPWTFFWQISCNLKVRKLARKLKVLKPNRMKERWKFYWLQFIVFFVAFFNVGYLVDQVHRIQFFLPFFKCSLCSLTTL